MSFTDALVAIFAVVWATAFPMIFYFVSVRDSGPGADLDFVAQVERDVFDYLGVHRMFEAVEFVKVRKDAKAPVRAYESDAGADIFAYIDDSFGGTLLLRPGAKALVPTGIAVGTPKGWVCDVRPRSGLAHKFHISIVNAPGTVDAGYTGEVMVNLENRGTDDVVIEHGDAIAQLVFLPVALPGFVEVPALGVTPRGDNGHGSTS